jgi:hypothetical protein
MTLVRHQWSLYEDLIATRVNKRMPSTAATTRLKPLPRASQSGNAQASDPHDNEWNFVLLQMNHGC